MDFFRGKKGVETMLADYESDDRLYVWSVEEAHQAAMLVFGLPEENS